MSKVRVLFNWLQNIISHFNAIILWGIMFVIFAQTFFRFVIFKSLPWSEELSRYLFVALIMLGFNIAVSRNMLVKIDLIDNVLSKRGKRILEIIREVIALIIMIFFLISAFQMIQVGGFQISPALQISMTVLYTIMAVGFVLTMIAIVVRIIEAIYKKEVEQ